MKDEIGTLKPGVDGRRQRCWPTSAAAGCCRTTKTRRCVAERFMPARLLPARRQALRCRRGDPAPADPGRRRMTAEQRGLWASAHRSGARKTRASCTGSAASSATSRRPACWKSPSCAAPSPMPGCCGVTKPAGAEKRVFTLADLPGVRTIRANSALPGFRVSEQPALAAGQAAPCRRSHRRLRGRHARRGRGSRGRLRARLRGAAGGARHAGRAAARPAADP